MKSLLLFLLYFCFTSVGLSQSCLPDGIIFDTQYQIDNFQSDYPGCTEIEGDVTFWGEDITNLVGLNILTSINGDLKIQTAGKLTDLTGLENINFIGGNLIIGESYYGSNPSLASLTGLNNLNEIGGDLRIDAWASLTNISSLENLTSIGGSLRISTDGLTNLSGLENVTSIGGDLTIFNNYALNDITALENINATSIHGLYIGWNYSLSDCQVQNLCDYLSDPNGTVDILWNAVGCNNPSEVAASCEIELPCLPFGDYNFYYQSEIDSFHVNYPDCTSLKGNVIIDGGNITNLLGLVQVISIEGSLSIMQFYNLNSLEGLENLTSVGGNLVFRYMDSLDNLNGLQNLNSIGGDFLFLENSSLSSMVGLENLTSIGGNMEISNNASLNSLTGLENLISIEGNLIIGYNETLPSLTGLEGLTSVGGDLEIYENASLTSFNGLNALSSIGNALNIGYNYEVINMTGFGELITIGRSINIENNHNLQNLNGLEGLITLGGDIIITYNPGLTSLSGLDNIDTDSIINLSVHDNNVLSYCEIESLCNYLTSPNGPVDIYNNSNGCNNPSEIAAKCGFSMSCLPYGNYNLVSQANIDNFQTDYPGCSDLNGDVNIDGEDITNLNGLSVVNSIGGTLSIHNNDSLVNLTGLEGLTVIGNGYISDNFNLNSLEGLGNLYSVIGNLKIEYNDALANLAGMNELTSISGVLQISDNDSLTDMTGLEGLRMIGGDFLIGGNINLYSLNGLENIDSLGGGLYIGIFIGSTVNGNPGLNNLTGLENLVNIEGSLAILFNPSLISLESLENLTSIGGMLLIEYNNSLQSLSGLDNLDAGTIKNLYIYYNNSLSICEVESICDYLVSPNGAVDILSNSPGCNNGEEVEAACTVGLNDADLSESSFSVFPNPSSKQITVKTSAFSNKSQVSVINLEGQEIIRRQVTGPTIVIDISDLPGGVYFVRLTGERMVGMKKFVKID